MKSYAEIAQETGTSIEQVRRAMNSAERPADTFDGAYAKWFVWTVGYGMWMDRYSHADGRGETREAAVIDALNRHPYMFR